MVSVKDANAMAEVIYYLKGIKQEDINKILKKLMQYLNENLAKVDNSIFGKIKLFFQNLFKNNIQESTMNENIIVEQEKNNTIEENNFVNNIKIQENKKDLRLQKMRKDLEFGEIIEKDLCEQELKELREFYLQQIEEKNNLLKIIKIELLE